MRLNAHLFALAVLVSAAIPVRAQSSAFEAGDPARAFARDDAGRTVPRPRALTVHPAFSLAISGLNLSYETPLGTGLWSCELPLYLGYNERMWSNPTFFAGSGFGVRRYLVSRGAGTYVSPSLDVVNIHRFEKGPEAGNNILMLAPNLRMGYRWTWNVFTMDAAMGFVYYESRLTEGKRTDMDMDQRGLLPMFQYSLGIPF
jgi:hypothetical protein